MHPAPQPPSVLSSYVRRDQVRPRFQRVGAMVRVRPIGTTAIVCLKLGFPVACVAIRGGDTAAGLAAELSARTGRRHRAARSMRCARPSDLHPDGRIAGFLARMRATPPAGARLDRTSHGSSCDQTAVFCPVGRASCPAGPRFGGADEIILSTCCSTLILRPTRRTFPNR